GRRRTRGSRWAGSAGGRTCSCPSRWGRSGRRGIAWGSRWSWPRPALSGIPPFGGEGVLAHARHERLPRPEHRHLGRRPNGFVHRPDRLEPDRIAETPGEALGPVLKFSPGPLEAVIGMSESFGPDVLPHPVVLPVGRREDDRPRPGELEDGPLE